MSRRPRALAMAAQGDLCCLHVRVQCGAQPGQTVAVCGSARAFQTPGRNAVPLVTTPESYPVWRTKHPIVLPRGEAITYKYCILEGGKIKVEEQCLTPRTLLPEALNQVVEDTFDLTQTGISQQQQEADILSSSKGLASNTSEGDLDWLNMGERHCRLFLVCYHLPVEIRHTGKPEDPFEIVWTDSLIAKTDGLIANNLETFWIGTLSVTQDLTDDDRETLLTKLSKFNCIPIFLDNELTSNAYYGFCKTVMWPVFHNVDQLDQIHAAWNLPPDYYDAQRAQGLANPAGNRSRSGSRVFDVPSGSSENKVLEWNKHASAFHSAYSEVNKIFADTIRQLSREGDIVWVHDYHLMFLPSLLRNHPAMEERPLKIVFFLHIPFPTSQIFRTLPQATQLLQSMTCADLVGFHAFDHARHFLNASRRMLGCRSQTRPGGMITLNVKDREVIVTMSHVSIETVRLDPVLADTSHPVFQLANELRAKYKGRRVVLGIDVGQRLSGVALKLAAFEKFLGDLGGDQARGIVLVQKSIRQGNRLEDEETTSSDIKKMVSSINQKFGLQSAARALQSSASGQDPKDLGVVVDYEEFSDSHRLGLAERMALYLVSDVFLITPIREGLNLMPLEYIYTRKLLPRAGVVVASEFSTCSSLLNGSLKVNPFAPASVADALSQALAMSSKDCEYRRQRDLPFIISHPSSQWTKRILCELEQLGSNSGRGRARTQKLPDPLQPAAIVSAFEAAAKAGDLIQTASRVFIFEYGGVLLHKEKFDIYIKQTLSAIAGRKPAESMLECITRLSDDPRNLVVVVTGLTRLKLGETFQELRNVTLATSNGLVYSWAANLPNAPGSAATDPAAVEPPCSPSSAALRQKLPQDGRAWECLECNVDWAEVAAVAGPIISRFTFRTNGTCQTPRFPGIGWSFFGADPEWGQRQALQLSLELEAALINHDVKITSLIPGSIEVVPRGLNKGLIVSKVLAKTVLSRAGKLPGFVMLITGEESDDGMTQAALNMVKDAPPQSGVQNVKVFSVTVGKRESPSQFYVNDVSDVESLLKSLVQMP